jgi:hypothetical protein
MLPLEEKQKYLEDQKLDWYYSRNYSISVWHINFHKFVPWDWTPPLIQTFTPSDIIYKQKSTKKVGLKYKLKWTKSTLINTILPKIPSLIILLFNMTIEFQCKFNVL